MDNELNLPKDWPRVLLGFVVMLLVAGVVFATARQYLRQDRGDVTIPGSNIQLEQKKEGDGAMTDEEKVKKLPGASGEESIVVQKGEGWIKLAKRVCDDADAADDLASQHPGVKTLTPGQELTVRCP